MRGLLSFTILWILSKGEKYGAEIADDLEERRGDRPNPGTLYPALQNLEEQGMVESEKRGRTRVYSITPRGERELDQACKYFYQSFGDILEECRAEYG